MIQRIFVVLFVFSRTAKTETPCAVISTNGESVEELTAKFGGCREIAELQINNSAINDFRFLKNFQRLLTGGRVKLFSNAHIENQMYNLTWLVVDGEWELHSDLCVLLSKRLSETLINADDTLNCGLSTLRVKSDEETKPSSDSVVTSRTAISPKLQSIRRLRSLAISMTVDEVDLSVFDQLEELGVAGELGDRSLLRIFGTVNAWNSSIFPNLKKINLPNYTNISPGPAVYIWANYRMCIPQGDRDRFVELVGNGTLVKIQKCMCSSEFPQVGCESHVNSLVLDSSLEYSQAVKFYRNLKHIDWGSLVLNTNYPDLAFLMRLEEITCASPQDAAVKFGDGVRTPLSLPNLKKITNCKTFVDYNLLAATGRISKAQRFIYKFLAPLMPEPMSYCDAACVVTEDTWENSAEMYKATSDCTCIEGPVLLDGKLLNNRMLGFLDMVTTIRGYVRIRNWEEESFLGLPNLRLIVLSSDKDAGIKINTRSSSALKYFYPMPEVQFAKNATKGSQAVDELTRRSLENQHQMVIFNFYNRTHKVDRGYRIACYHARELAIKIAINEYLFWYSFPLSSCIFVITVAVIHLRPFISGLVAKLKHKN